MTKLYEKMLFNNYDDFFIKRQFLKSVYVLLSLNEKRKYNEHIKNASDRESKLEFLKYQKKEI